MGAIKVVNAWTFFLRILLICGGVVLAIMLHLWLSHIPGYGQPLFLFFFPVVIVAALVGGLWDGLLATLLAVVVVDYYIYPPKGSMKMLNLGDILSLVIFAMMGVTISLLAEYYSRARIKASTYEHKQALREMQKKLHEREVMFHLAASSGHVGGWQWNIKTGELTMDATYKQIYGLAPDVVSNIEEWKGMLYPEDREGVLRFIGSELREQGEGFYEHRIVRPDGEIRWVGTMGYIDSDSDGNPVFACGINMDITDRKLVEQELQQSREQLRVTLASIGDGVISCDCSEQVTYMNPVAESLCGWLAKEAVGKPIASVLELINESTGKPVDSIATKVLNEGGTFSFANSVALRTHDGRIVPVEDSAAPILDSTGKISGAVLVFHDVTAWRRQRDQLLTSENRYRMLVESFPEAIYVDRNNTIDYANPAALALFGATSLEEFSGKNPYDLFHPSEHAAIRERVCKLQKGHAAPLLEQKIIRFDGEVRLAEVLATPIVDSKGTAILVIVTDITERRRTEEAMHRYQVLAECSRDGLLLVDAKSARIIDANPAVEQIYGYSREEMCGLSIFELRPPEVPDLTREQIDAALAGGMLLETVHQRKNGESFPVEISSQGANIGGVSYLVSAIRDITLRKKTEQALMQNERLIAIGRLAGTVAHDFNNQLQIINASAALIAERCADSPQLAERAHAIYRAGERAAQMTRQLLVFSRKSVTAPKNIDPEMVLRGMERLLAQLAGAQIEVQWGNFAGKGLIRIDSNELEQVIIGLFLNACDAMPEGGKITLGMESRHIEQKTQMFCGELDLGDYLLIAISDSGSGMAPSTMQQIFDPFFTTKEPGKGTGLGLSTVQQIVKQCSGQIDVHSTPGHGSRFDVYLPKLKDEVLSPAREASTEEESGGRPVVLLAEDEEMVRHLLGEQLNSLGFDVVEATDGEDALRKASGEIERFDLVITDMVMPKMNGRDLAHHLRQLRSGIRILLMSGYTNCPLTPEELRTQRLHFLSKPFTRASLSSAIKEIMAEGEQVAAK